jgi:hypothetical protein
MRNFWVGLLVGLLIAIGWNARSEDWLIVSGVAKHLDGQQHCNSTTSGLGWERSQNGVDRYQIGFYRNSNCRYSAYAAKAWLPLQYSHWRFGTVGGLATGYKYAVTPAGGLAVTYELQHVGSISSTSRRSRTAGTSCGRVSNSNGSRLR